MSTPRFQVIPKSQSSHCCFEATVVDTTKPSEYRSGQYEAVCECFELEQANLIAASLNATDGAACK